MAVATSPVTFTTAVVAAPGTSVAVAAQPPDNCHTILVTNPSSTLTVLVGFATAPAALTAGSNAQRVGPGLTLTLALGTSAVRGFIANLVCDAIGGAVTPEVTYLNRLGATL